MPHPPQAPSATQGQVVVDGLAIAYRSQGAGPPVLLVHGWPTSSFLWRNVMPALAAHRRVIAIDLPGFGASDKPLDVTYDLPFFARILDGFLAALEVDTLGLVVHDMGGPAALYWAAEHPERIERLGILNTLIYPEVSFAVRAFIAAIGVPGLRGALTSQWGLALALDYGLHDRSRRPADAREGTLAPFRSPEARRALARTAQGITPADLRPIAAWLPTVEVPVQVIYGTRDRILPDMAQTARRLKEDIPHAEVTPLEGCGHFLQEERPDEIGRLLADFFAA